MVISSFGASSNVIYVGSNYEWNGNGGVVLDQYKESTPSDPTIRERFNTYRFADYKEKVIDLLQRVCTVSVETVKVVRGMPIW